MNLFIGLGINFRPIFRPILCRKGQNGNGNKSPETMGYNPIPLARATINKLMQTQPTERDKAQPIQLELISSRRQFARKLVGCFDRIAAKQTHRAIIVRDLNKHIVAIA